MERTEASVCLLFLVFVWWKMRQQTQDKKMEVQQRQRQKLMLAARRKRAIQRHAIRLQRMQSRQEWMETMMHHYYTNIIRTTEVWADQRTSDWWENTAQRFTDEQWLGDFRVLQNTRPGQTI